MQSFISRARHSYAWRDSARVPLKVAYFVLFVTWAVMWPLGYFLDVQFPALMQEPLRYFTIGVAALTVMAVNLAVQTLLRMTYVDRAFAKAHAFRHDGGRTR